MLLVWFKREFEWDQILRLWEVLWTDYLSSQFVLFLALALLDKHKDVIMTHLQQFDEVLKYMNDLSMTIDLEDLLVRAEILFKRFKRTVDMIDRKQALQEPVSSTPDDFSAGDDNKDKVESNQLPKISEELRLLLSRKVIVVKETERPPNATGG